MDTSCQDVSERERLPWGFWPTIGLSLLTIIILFVAQIAVVIIYLIAAKLRQPNIDLLSLDSNSLLFAIEICVSAPLIIVASLFFAKFRGTLPIKEYFRIYKPEKHQYFKWILALLLLALCSDGLSILLGKPAVPEFMVDVYRTAYFTPLLWFAMIIAAPLGEEILFRGFLFKGIENSRIGGGGAVIISSLVWAPLHMQYDLYGIGTIFVMGLVLGIARLKSNSIYIPIMMHSIWSLIATIEVAIYVGL